MYIFRLYCGFSGLGDSTSVMFCGSFHARAMYLKATGQQSQATICTYLHLQEGRACTHFVWLPLATSSSCSFVKRMEVYASVLPTVITGVLASALFASGVIDPAALKYSKKTTKPKKNKKKHRAGHATYIYRT